MKTTEAITGPAKWCLLACAGLWLLAAAVQLNDRDPTGWIAVYTSAAAVLLWVVRAPRAHHVAAGLALGTGSWGLALGPQLILEVPMDQFLGRLAMQSEQVELARESWGLLLLTANLVATFVIGRKRSES